MRDACSKGRLRRLSLALGLASSAFLVTCDGKSNRPATTTAAEVGGRTFELCNPQTALREALISFSEAREGDTIEFCAGRFELSTGLILQGKRGITIRGAGKDATILAFSGSDSSEGINASHADGLVIEGLTVEDTPGNAIRVFRSSFVTLRDVRARWSDCSADQPGFQPCATNGAYGLYPVECRHVLIEDAEVIGASDAGVYVGQTSDVVVRRTRAEYNVAGFEFENTYRAVFEDNVATRNVGGFLVFDLPGLSQYGEKNIVRNNRSFGNNTDNFAPVGNIVGLVPRGTGMLVLATDQLEVYGNEIRDNDTAGLVLVNFALADPAQPDPKYDFFPEGIHVHDNRFTDNGGNPQEPNLERGEATLLPLLLRIKNLGRSAHVVWDGAVDRPNGCAEVPVDAAGVPLTSPNPAERDRYEARSDERGRPNLQRGDPNPKCKWTRWKFQPSGALKRPENGLCIVDNTFSNTKPETLLVTDFLNGNLTSSDPATLLQDLLLKPGSTDLAPHRCRLPALSPPSLRLPFQPNPQGDDAPPTKEEIAAACHAPANGQVNWSAALRFDCPRLEDYGLFGDGADPRAAPNGGGVRFELQSALFSDYAVKYRFLFLPPGTKASYRDHETAPTATLEFPVGTILAKTFAFRSGDRENVVETRLLIKRESAQGVSWVGLPYIWTGDGENRRAELHLEGGSASVSYDYDDPDPEVAGNHHYQGAAERYGIPASLNCITCHGGDDREPGAAPIGLKPRNLNRDVAVDGGGQMNQLQLLVERGYLDGLPSDLAKVERLPRWNVPGDGGQPAGSSADVHSRARAYLEVNCMHCHNPAGGASNSGLFLDSFRAVDVSYGICKKPVAAGKGSGNRRYDIVPGSASESILPFRVSSVEPGIRMPPLSRTVVHAEAADLITRWIDDVLPTSDTQNEEACTGPLAGLPVALPIPLPGLP